METKIYVQLKPWVKRWYVTVGDENFTIRRGEVKECSQEILDQSGGRLEKVSKATTKVKKSKKQSKKSEGSDITAFSASIPEGEY